MRAPFLLCFFYVFFFGGRPSKIRRPPWDDVSDLMCVRPISSFFSLVFFFLGRCDNHQKMTLCSDLTGVRARLISASSYLPSLLYCGMNFTWGPRADDLPHLQINARGNMHAAFSLLQVHRRLRRAQGGAPTETSNRSHPLRPTINSRENFFFPLLQVHRRLCGGAERQRDVQQQRPARPSPAGGLPVR